MQAIIKSSPYVNFSQYDTNGNGDTVTFQVTIQNVSNVPFDGNYPLNFDLYVDGKKIGSSSFYRCNLQPGARKTFALTPQWTAAFGSHKLNIVVNPSYVYDETSHPITESN